MDAQAVQPATWAAVEQVLALLEQEYGPVHYAPRADPISELVAAVLSQHTSDRNSARAFRRLKERFGSWEAVAQGDVKVIAESIEVGGLAHVKAPRIKAILNQIWAERGCLDLGFLRQTGLEEAKAWLRRLPGVGPKSAAVVLCFSLGMPAMPVDTHVFRVARRLGLLDSRTTPEQAHQVLEAMVPPEKVYPFHVFLINHGRRVCRARRPLCPTCVVNQLCPSRQPAEGAAAKASGEIVL